MKFFIIFALIISPAWSQTETVFSEEEHSSLWARNWAYYVGGISQFFVSAVSRQMAIRAVEKPSPTVARVGHLISVADAISATSHLVTGKELFHWPQFMSYLSLPSLANFINLTIWLDDVLAADTKIALAQGYKDCLDISRIVNGATSAYALANSGNVLKSEDNLPNEASRQLAAGKWLTVEGGLKHIMNGANPNTVISDENVLYKRMTLLQASMAAGKLDIVKFLLERGGDLNMAFPDSSRFCPGLTMPQAALFDGRPDILKLFLERGLVDFQAVFPASNWKYRGMTFAQAAVLDGWPNILELFLERRLGNVLLNKELVRGLFASKENGILPLHALLAKNDIATALAVIDAMDPEHFGLQDKHGRTALQFILGASWSGTYCVVKNPETFSSRMIARMTSKQLGIKDRNGDTALHLAVRNGHVNIVEELISKMSAEQLGWQNADRETALDLSKTAVEEMSSLGDDSRVVQRLKAFIELSNKLIAKMPPETKRRLS